MRNYIIVLCVFFIGSSCIKEAPQEDFAPKFVVEGVIEEGGYAQVKVTHNIPKGFIIDKDQLEELIVRWATVRVYSDTEEEVLTLIRDEEVFPYYFYQGRSLRGKAGETYHLEVVYNDVVLKSKTSIPLYKPQIAEVGFRSLNEYDALPSVTIGNDEATANYLLFSKLSEQRSFYATNPKGFKAEEKPSGQYKTEFLRSHALLDTAMGKQPYYANGDDIVLKVSNISEESQRLWSAYTQQSIQFSFLNYSSNFRGNIEGDGIGIWYGANSAIEPLHIK